VQVSIGGFWSGANPSDDGIELADVYCLQRLPGDPADV